MQIRLCCIHMTIWDDQFAVEIEKITGFGWRIERTRGSLSESHRFSTKKIWGHWVTAALKKEQPYIRSTSKMGGPPPLRAHTCGLYECRLRNNERAFSRSCIQVLHVCANSIYFCSDFQPSVSVMFGCYRCLEFWEKYHLQCSDKLPQITICSSLKFDASFNCPVNNYLIDYICFIQRNVMQLHVILHLYAQALY